MSKVMVGYDERRFYPVKIFTMLTAVALTALVVAGCPRPELISSGPKRGVVRAEYQFYNPVMGHGVNAVVLYPRSKNQADKPLADNSSPLVLLLPGFLDTSFGLEYLGRALAQEGFYVVIPDPDDALNIFPQGSNDWLVTHWPELAAAMQDLAAELEAIGYPVEAESAIQMLMWFYGSLDGTITDPEVLSLCQRVFDYRLTDAETIIGTCLNKRRDLPAKELIKTDTVLVAGHSLGGFTALQLAGASGVSRLPVGLVKAALLMAPATGFYSPGDMEQVRVPTYWLKAGLDRPNINGPMEDIFPFCPEPKRLKEYPWFEHADFSDTFRILYETGEVGLARQEKVVREVVKFFSRVCDRE